MELTDGALNSTLPDDVEQHIQEDIAKILAPDEQVKRIYPVIRDQFVFTDKRLILIDKQGLTGGGKLEYHSIPYRSITHFSIETSGAIDLDAELKIWISGTVQPIQRLFNEKTNIYEVQSLLAACTLR